MLLIAGLAVALAPSVRADGPPIEVHRASGPITIDGDLSDPGWKDATRIDQWWETNPGENAEPKAKSVGYLAYDDRFFYAGFEFDDPQPSKIQGPYNDRDHIGGNTDDYGGVILDTRDDGKTAILFLVNPRNIQYDSVSDDSTGNEDSSPDFFWDSATRITSKGWTLERDPFLLETNIPGIFAVGDVRHGSVKRVASGVGEGSVAVQFVHQYLSKV